jgi:hypothetical protein
MKAPHPFNKRLQKIPPKILKLLTNIDECKGGGGGTQWPSSSNVPLILILKPATLVALK